MRGERGDIYSPSITLSQAYGNKERYLSGQIIWLQPHVVNTKTNGIHTPTGNYKNAYIKERSTVKRHN